MAISINGTDDFVACGSGTSMDNMTAISISGWVKYNALHSTGTAAKYVNRLSSGTAGWYLDEIHAADGTYDLRLLVGWSGAPTYATWEASHDAPTTSAWVHVAATNSNLASSTADPIFYWNGAAVSSTETQAPTGARTADGGVPLAVGVRNWTPLLDPINAQMEDVRVFNRVLSANEIATLAAGYRGPLGGEVLWLPMDEQDGATLSSAAAVVFDMSGNGNHGTPQGGCLGAASYAPRMNGWIP